MRFIQSLSTILLVCLLSSTFLSIAYACNVDFGVFWDPGSLEPVTVIDWGMLRPGQNGSVDLFVKNLGDVDIVLSLATGGWIPVEAAEHLDLSLNYAGGTLHPGETLWVQITLSANSSVLGISSFSFNITINATNIVHGITRTRTIASSGSIVFSEVHNLDTGLVYPAIQEAIDAEETLNGHTIFVETGTFYEHVVVDKVLSIIGENKTATVVDGSGAGTVMNITVNGVTVAGLTLRNGAIGICMFHVSGCNVTDSSIVDHVAGVSLIGASQNRVETSSISNCTETGLHLVNSTVNKFHGCTVANNTEYGAVIHRSSDSEFYHNNFVDNGMQVFDDSTLDPLIPPSLNVWDNGYPFGGVYWSDYIGEDSFSGPDQNEVGSDHIGDTPRTIDASNVDMYPLMGSFGSETMDGLNSTVFPSSEVSLMFWNITEEGSTTAERVGSGPFIPWGIELLGEYHVIETTVMHSGPILIRIIYSDANLTLDEEADLKLLQWDELTHEWLNITTRVDIESNVIYGLASHLSVFGVTKLGEKVFVNATVEVHPDILNLHTRGEWLEVYITLSEGYNHSDILTPTLRLNRTVGVDSETPIDVGDSVKVLFNRTAIVEWILLEGIAFDNVTLTVTGDLQRTESFKGSANITVSSLVGDVNCDGEVNLFDIIIASADCFSPTTALNSNANFAPSWSRIDIFDIVTIVSHYGEKQP